MKGTKILSYGDSDSTSNTMNVKPSSTMTDSLEKQYTHLKGKRETVLSRVKYLVKLTLP